MFLDEEAVPGASYRCPMCRHGEPPRAGEAKDTRLRRDWVAALTSQDAQDRKHRLKKEAAAPGGGRGGRANGKGKHSNGERQGGQGGQGGAAGGGGSEGGGAAALSLVGGGAGGKEKARGGSKKKNSGRAAAPVDERVLDHMENDGLEDNVGPEQWERQLRDFKRQVDMGDGEGVRRFEMVLDGADLKDDLPDNGAPWVFFEQVRYFLATTHALHQSALDVCTYILVRTWLILTVCVLFLFLLCRCVHPRWTR